MSDDEKAFLFFVGGGVLLVLILHRISKFSHDYLDGPKTEGSTIERFSTWLLRDNTRVQPAGSLLGDITGVVAIGILLGVAAYFTPAEALNRGLYIFIFALVAVIGVNHWHRNDVPTSSREWAATLGKYALATLVIAAVGVAVGYTKGTPGGPLDMIKNTGTFLLLITFCPALILVAVGGVVRAAVIERSNMTSNNTLEADREA